MAKHTLPVLQKPETWPEVFRPERWNPFREISKLHRNIEKMFDEFFEPALGPSGLGGFPRETEFGFCPACDVSETDTNYLLNMDLPGVPKENIGIQVRDNQLYVCGERKAERKREEEAALGMERYYGTFQRTFSLPSSIDPNKIEATYENGVLQISIPKAEGAKAKEIKITEAKPVPKPVMEKKEAKAA